MLPFVFIGFELFFMFIVYILIYLWYKVSQEQKISFSSDKAANWENSRYSEYNTLAVTLSKKIPKLNDYSAIFGLSKSIVFFTSSHSLANFSQSELEIIRQLQDTEISLYFLETIYADSSIKGAICIDPNNIYGFTEREFKFSGLCKTFGISEKQNSSVFQSQKDKYSQNKQLESQILFNRLFQHYPHNILSLPSSHIPYNCFCYVEKNTYNIQQQFTHKKILNEFCQSSKIANNYVFFRIHQDTLDDAQYKYAVVIVIFKGKSKIISINSFNSVSDLESHLLGSSIEKTKSNYSQEPQQDQQLQNSNTKTRRNFKVIKGAQVSVAHTNSVFSKNTQFTNLNLDFLKSVLGKQNFDANTIYIISFNPYYDPKLENLTYDLKRYYNIDLINNLSRDNVEKIHALFNSNYTDKIILTRAHLNGQIFWISLNLRVEGMDFLLYNQSFFSNLLQDLKKPSQQAIRDFSSTLNELNSKMSVNLFRFFPPSHHITSIIALPRGDPEIIQSKESRYQKHFHYELTHLLVKSHEMLLVEVKEPVIYGELNIKFGICGKVDYIINTGEGELDGRYNLSQGINLVYVDQGGYIYVENKSTYKTYNLKIFGGTRCEYFELGKFTRQDLRKVNSTQILTTFIGRRCILHFSIKYLNETFGLNDFDSVQKFNSLLELIDKTINCVDRICGFDHTDPNSVHYRNPEQKLLFWIADRPDDEDGQEAYSCFIDGVVLLANTQTARNLKNLKNDRISYDTLVHEIAHSYMPVSLSDHETQFREISISMIVNPVMSEILDSGTDFYNESHFIDYFYYLDYQDYFTYIGSNPYGYGYVLFEQLRIAYGTEFNTKLLRIYRENTFPLHGSNWRQLFVYRCCHAAKRRLIKFFDEHRFETEALLWPELSSEQFREVIDNLYYPECKPIWLNFRYHKGNRSTKYRLIRDL